MNTLRGRRDRRPLNAFNQLFRVAPRSSATPAMSIRPALSPEQRYSRAEAGRHDGLGSVAWTGIVAAVAAGESRGDDDAGTGGDGCAKRAGAEPVDAAGLDFAHLARGDRDPLGEGARAARRIVHADPRVEEQALGPVRHEHAVDEPFVGEAHLQEALRLLGRDTDPQVLPGRDRLEAGGLVGEAAGG